MSTQTFDLKLHFTGMCLYVRDPERNRMHVLMPQSGGHGHAEHGTGGGGGNGPRDAGGHERHHHNGHRHDGGDDGDPAHAGHAPPAGGVEAHVVRVFADAAHLFPGTGARSGIVAGVAKLDDRVLDLAGLGDPPLDLDLSGRELGDVGAILGQPVPRKRVDGPDERVFCRVTMDSGRATGHAPGAVWEVDGVEQPLTYRIEWTLSGVRAQDGALRLRTLSRDGIPAKPLPELYPLPAPDTGRPTVDLHVFHTPERELPPWPRPERGAPSGHHFVGLYDLFDEPGKRPVPRFVRSRPGPKPGPIGTDPSRCMGGSGTTGGS